MKPTRIVITVCAALALAIAGAFVVLQPEAGTVGASPLPERQAAPPAIPAPADSPAVEPEAEPEPEPEPAPEVAPAPVRVAPEAHNDPRPGCEGDWPIPAWIVQRESGCNYGAVNATGCGGWSCVGAYQFDLRHWIARDQGGWGGCAHLGDWRDPSAQDACAEQMSHGGTNLRPWGY